MSERIVTHTLKNTEDDITFLCEPHSDWSPRSIPDAIADIDSGSHSYVVRWPGQPETSIRVIDDPRGKYLRTDRDFTTANNLDELPDCSGWGLPLFLGDYPKSMSTGWSQDSQGVCHDDANWYFTQSKSIVKIPTRLDLAETPNPPESSLGVLRSSIPTALKDQGFNHFGDPDFAAGFVLVPVDGSGGKPRIAAFSTLDLSLVTSAEIPISGSTNAGWLAVDSANAIMFTSQGLVDSTHPIARLKYDPVKLAAGQLDLDYDGDLIPQDPSGNALKLEHMQGGVIGQDGRLLITNGFPRFSKNRSGIHILDPKTGVRFAKSSAKSLPFLFKFDPGFFDREEPEGLTWWNLDGSSSPGIGGQLHVVLRDNNWISSHGLIFKHYRVQEI